MKYQDSLSNVKFIILLRDWCKYGKYQQFYLQKNKNNYILRWMISFLTSLHLVSLRTENG